MSKINLIPEVKLEKIRLKRLNFVFGFGAVVIGAVMIMALIIILGLQLTRTQAMENTKDKIDEAKEELKDYSGLEQTVINIEKGIKSIKEVTENQHQWSLFLPHLEKITPNDIRFAEFTQSGDNFKAKAEGRTVKSIARLIVSLEDYKYKKDAEDYIGRNLFKNIVVTGYNKKLDGMVNFDISFDLESGMLW